MYVRMHGWMQHNIILYASQLNARCYRHIFLCMQCMHTLCQTCEKLRGRGPARTDPSLDTSHCQVIHCVRNILRKKLEVIQSSDVKNARVQSSYIVRSTDSTCYFYRCWGEVYHTIKLFYGAPKYSIIFSAILSDKFLDPPSTP